MRHSRILTAALPVAALVLGLAASPASAATLPPVLTAPASSSSATGPVTISYTLGEAPLSSTVTLSFVGASTCQLILTDVTTASFALDPTTPLASPNVVSAGCASIAPGTYTVALSYQNAASEPPASAFATGVVLNAATTTTTSTTSTTSTSTTTVPVATTTTTVGATGLPVTTTVPTDVAGAGASTPRSAAPGVLAFTGSSTIGRNVAWGVALIVVGALLLARRRRLAR